MTIKDDIERELQGWAYLGHPAPLQRFILRNGTENCAQALPKGFRRGTPKQCFSNAYKLMFSKGLTYVEGYALSDDIPLLIHHAWVIDGSGNAIDNTLKEPQKYKYYGVPFSQDEVNKQIAKTGYYGLLTSDIKIDIDFMFEVDPEFKANWERIVKECKATSELRNKQFVI